MMDRFIYTAMTGAKHTMGQLGNTAHNLANVQTPGFREMLSSFRAVPVDGVSADSRAFVVDSTPGSDFTPGAVNVTGNPLDVSIKGPGFFAVRRADGSEVYTRAGNFSLDDQGFLRGPKGSWVQGLEGDILIEPGSSDLLISADGQVQVTLPGDLAATVVGQLKLVDPPVHSLVRDPDGFYRAGDEPLPASTETRVLQGSLEASNVNVAQAMVQMIQQNRLFDLNVRLIQVADQNAKTAGTLMSLSRG